TEGNESVTSLLRPRLSPRQDRQGTRRPTEEAEAAGGALQPEAGKTDPRRRAEPGRSSQPQVVGVMGRRRSRGAMSVRSVAAVLFALCSAATLAGPASAATAAAQRGEDPAAPLLPDGLRESGGERHGRGGPQQQPRRGQRTGPAQEGRFAEHAFSGDHGLREPRHEIAAGVGGRIEATVATSEIAARENAPSRGRAPW
ncbi:unnamed protein product, partial [Scytosiphon promiscuus]